MFLLVQESKGYSIFWHNFTTRTDAEEWLKSRGLSHRGAILIRGLLSNLYGVHCTQRFDFVGSDVHTTRFAGYIHLVVSSSPLVLDPKV